MGVPGPRPRVLNRLCAHLPRTPLKHHPLSRTQMAPPRTPCKPQLRRAGSCPSFSRAGSGVCAEPLARQGVGRGLRIKALSHSSTVWFGSTETRLS